MGNVYSQNAVAKYLENSSILKARLKVVFNFLLTARPWAERGSCSARGFFFFVFVSPDADLRG